MRKNRFQKKKKSSLKRIIFAGLFFCLFVGLGYLAIWWPKIWIEDVQVEGKAVYYSPADIEEIAWQKIERPFWWKIPRRSIIFVPISQIENEVLNRYPEVKTVEVVRHLPRSLVVKMEERENIGVWCQIQKTKNKEQGTNQATSTEEVIKEEREIEQCFYFDREGVIFRSAPLISGSLVLNVYGVNQSPQIRDEIIEPKMIEFILTIREGMPKIKIAYGSLPEAADFEIVSFEDLRMTTARGWQIYFNPEYSAESQLRALEVVWEDEIKDSINDLEYIDLRIEGRVYYR